jgi:hypothetical protein
MWGGSIGLLGILLLGVLTMWYILYLKIVKAVGRRRRDLNPGPSWSCLLQNSHMIIHTGTRDRNAMLKIETA